MELWFCVLCRADLPDQVGRAVFARYLNLTVGSQIERGAERPSGPVLVFLNLIRRRGIGAIL